MKALSRIILTRTSFRQQLVLTFTIGIVCSALISSLAISSLSSRAVRAKLIEEGRQVTENFAAESTLALLYHSADNAKDSARATLAFPDVGGVAIYDTERYVLLAEGESILLPVDNGPWPDQLRLEQETALAWYFVAPVYARRNDSVNDESPFLVNLPEPELIGFVRVMMGKETLKTMAEDILRGNLMVSMTLASVLLLLLLAITKRLTTPLKNLADIMRRAKQGETHLRAVVRGPRDVIDMETAFNTMMEVIETREEELKRTRDAALESARIKGEFAANVSHELRTPLNGVLGMLELLADMGLTAKQAEYVEVARNSGESLLGLIDDILDFSRIESGKLKPNPVDFCLQEVLDDVISVLGGQAQRKDLDFGYVIPPDLPHMLYGEPTRIRQVLINLVGNAIKFTEQGEVAVEVNIIEDKETKVLLGFDVRDTGIGIPREAQQRIFEAFSQADGSTTRKYGGTGLGLTICRQLVTFMGGEISVESEPGKGSKFYFELPLEISTKAFHRPELSRAEVAGLRALVVDDSAVNRRFLEQLFNSWGIYYQSSSNGSEALEILRTAAAQGKPFELAIVDELMPGLKGTGLVRQIAKDPAIAQVKVIMMTNRKLSGRDRQGLTACVAKPLREAFLYNCIVRVIKRREKSVVLPFLPAGSAAGICLGSAILVVEDNRANQQVAIGMLQRLGCRADVATSGWEAVEAVVRGSYDLVLMDCNMPQMDGYEATRRIRALEAKRSCIPIIAMTANVREGDSEKCLAAGMNDFLPKPLKLERLWKKLQHWLTSTKSETAMTTDMSTSDELVETGSDTVIRDEPIEKEVFRELRDSIGDAFPRMIEAYLEDMPDYLEALKKAVAKGDARELAEIAHSVKGASRNFGANWLAGVCKQLEDIGHSGITDKAANLLDALITEYDLVKVGLQHEVKPDREQHVAVYENQSRILIVDDDRGMRVALRRVLEEDGYRIEEAANGAQALALCERHMPDLVLMDAVMPVMDGFSACSQIRQKPSGGAAPPVLIITALDDNGSIERAFLAGATDYIPKPVHFAVLRQRVARLLQASRAEKHVRKLAYQDSLTGLPNRVLFTERLGELLTRTNHEEQMFAILFLDLDRFKLVNDTLGHDTGDLLLKAVAERILGCMRAGDLVARLGGDEFTIILDNVRVIESVIGVAKKICQVVSKPYVFMRQEMYVTISIGIAMYPADGRDIGTLMKRADTAMFRAKEMRNGYQFYEPGMGVEVTRRLELETELRQALERNELIVHYQPQANIMTGKIVGMEALVRWQHPTRGLLLPSEFIPIAEETDLIVSVGEWVLRSACGQLQGWLQQGFEPLRVAVNLSSRQLESPDLAQKIAAILKETGLPPHLLELEITEGAIMKHPENVISILNQLKEMGVQLAVDDFGIGYSSLGSLKRFPVDMLKVDRSFVRSIGTNRDDVAIISGIIALGRSLGLKIIAEGVETGEQESFLRKQRCDLMQGFYISKPLPATTFEQRYFLQKKAHKLISAKISPIRGVDKQA